MRRRGNVIVRRTSLDWMDWSEGRSVGSGFEAAFAFWDCFRGPGLVSAMVCEGIRLRV